MESRPQGSEGDNVVKTRLSTGDMSDIFQYNSGSLFQALAPAQNLAPVTDQPFAAQLDENFTQTVTADGSSTACRSTRRWAARSSTTRRSTRGSG